MAQLGLSMILIILPLKMLSGDATPLESMPEIVQNIMLIAHHSLHQIRPSYFISRRGMGSCLAVFSISLVTLSKISGAFLRPL
jgi:ABC-2 type transport system permease protein